MRSRPICVVIQGFPAFGTMCLLQKLEFLVVFLHAINMNSLVAFGATWVWIHRHDFKKFAQVDEVGFSNDFIFNRFDFRVSTLCFDEKSFILRPNTYTAFGCRKFYTVVTGNTFKHLHFIYPESLMV